MFLHNGIQTCGTHSKCIGINTAQSYSVKGKCKIEILIRNQLNEKIEFQFLSNVMAPLLAKYNLTNSLLNEYCRRSLLDPLAKKQNARTSSQTSDGIYCAHFSSTQKILIVQKYNSISNGWDDVKSLSCVSTCIRYIVANGKLFIICDQDHMDCIRIVESYDLNSFDRSVYSRVMSWRAGFRPIAVDDYIYMLGGVGWHCDSSAESSIGSLERCVGNIMNHSLFDFIQMKFVFLFLQTLHKKLGHKKRMGIV